MASLRDPKLMQSPRCQHHPTAHSYARSLVRFSSTTSFCLTCPSSREPLYHLMEKHTKWKGPQQDAFQKLKQMLTNNTVLAPFDPSCPVGISRDASESVVGAVLFKKRHRDNPERPIANASKTLIDAQKR